MKRLLLIGLLLASFLASAQTPNGVNTRPPGLPDFSIFRLDPFSFSFQIVPANYQFDGAVVAEIRNTITNAIIIDSAAISVTVNANYVTVSLTQQQVASLPAISQLYISWGDPRVRRLGAKLKPGNGTGPVDRTKYVIDIFEVQVTGDTYASLQAASRAEAALDSAQQLNDTVSVNTTLAITAKDSSVSNALKSRISADSSLARSNRANASKIAAIAQAATATQKALESAVNADSTLARAIRSGTFADSSLSRSNRAKVFATNAQASAASAATSAAGIITPIGTYNATTGVATITETGVNYTPTSTADKPLGSVFTVVVAGTQSITGLSTTMVVGGAIRSSGTKWAYIPPSSAALSRIIALEGKFPTVNYFNPATSTDGFILNSTGSTSANAAYGITDTIRVVPGEVWSTSDTVLSPRRVNFYTSALANIQSAWLESPTNSTTSFVIPATANFIRVSYYLSRKAKTQIEKSFAPTSWVPYGYARTYHVKVPAADVEPDANNARVSTTEKSAYAAKLGVSDITIDRSKNLFTTVGTVDGFSLTSTGNPQVAASYFISAPIKVNPGDVISTQDGLNVGTAGVRYVNFFKSDSTHIASSQLNLPSTTLTFTAPALTSYIKVTALLAQKSKVQVEKASAPTEYTSYYIRAASIAGIGIKATAAETVTDTAHLFIATSERVKWNGKLSSSAVVSIASKNLFDPATRTDGFILGSTGVASANVLYGVTAAIPVIPGQVISFWDGNRGVRRLNYFNSGTHVGAAYLDAITITATVPSGVTDVRASYYLDRVSTLQIEVAPQPTTYVSHTPQLVSVAGAVLPPSTGGGTTVDVLTPGNADALSILGCSYAAGHGTSIESKHWIGLLARFSNLVIHNFGVSGNRLTDITDRIRQNTANRFTTRSFGMRDAHSKYAAIQNIGNESINAEVYNSNLYRKALRQQVYAAQGTGAFPIFTTDWMIRNPDLGAVFQDVANEFGSVFHNIGVLGDRFLTAGTPAIRWSGSHPDTRGQAITFNEWKYLVDTYMPVKKGMWIGRPISNFIAASIQDYNYDDFDQRAKIFVPIKTGQSSISTANEVFIDRTANITPSASGANQLNYDEWIELKTKNPVSFTNVAVVELVFDKINNTAMSIYVKMASNGAMVPYIKNNFLSSTYAPTSPYMFYHNVVVSKSVYDAITVNNGDTYTTTKVTDGTTPLTLTAKGKYFSPGTGYIVGLASSVEATVRSTGSAGTLTRVSGSGASIITFTEVSDALSAQSFEFLTSVDKPDGGFESVASKLTYDSGTGYYKITLTTADLANYVKYDNLKLLINIPSTTFTISDVYAEYSGGIEKVMPNQRYKPKPTFTEKLADNAIVSGWDSGKWINDNSLTLKTMSSIHADYPTGYGISSHITLGFGVDNMPNIIRRTVTVTPKTGSRKVLVRAIVRTFPKLLRPDLTASSETTTTAVITKDSYDFSYLVCGIKGQNTGLGSPGTVNTINEQKRVVPIGWEEAYYEFDLPPLQSSFEIQFHRDFRDVTGQANYLNHTFDLDVAWISVQVEGE